MVNRTRREGEDGKAFADRLMKERYGDDWKKTRGTGPNTEHNQIKKYNRGKY